MDQIYTLRTIIQSCLEYHNPLYINFVGFKAAFDFINREYIWKAFEHYGLPGKYIRIFKAFLMGLLALLDIIMNYPLVLMLALVLDKGIFKAHLSSTYVSTWLQNVSR